MATLALKVLGAVLLLVGLLAFVGNPIVGADGMFMTNMNHDLVHILSGVVLLAVAFAAPARSALAALVFGVAYLLVAILGFTMEGPILGFIDANATDHMLHIALAVVFLALAFKGKKASSPAPMSAQPM